MCWVNIPITNPDISLRQPLGSVKKPPGKNNYPPSIFIHTRSLRDLTIEYLVIIIFTLTMQQ